MESASKRKAAGGAAVENEGRPSKRQKGSVHGGGTAETVDTTRTQGLKFLETLKQAKDKTGRPIAIHFLTLPDKNVLPEYYDVIKLPIAIDTIEDKLNRGEYATLAQVESDQKRLVNNAKAFNDKRSIVYEDAERLRKTASNWMVKHNPAYRTQKNYTAQPTPVPGEEPLSVARTPRVVPATPKPAAPTPTSEVTTDRPRRAAATAAAQQMTPAPSKLRHSASAAPDEAEESPDFDGKTFQQAQEQIVRELIEYTEPESGLPIFLPFVQLPSRALKDYYQLIKEPMSLTAVQKKVKGVIGRNAPTGITELKSWDAFEQMASLIWKNARVYNEDGSDLYNVSLELEEMFTKRLADAKAKVAEPPQPKLKLNMSVAAPSSTPPAAAAVPKQQLKLKLRQSPVSDPNTPRARSSATPGFIVDNEALLRQQKHVMESMNGTRSSRPTSAGKSNTPVPAANPFTGLRGAATSIPSLPMSQTRTAGSPPVLNGASHVQSPALSAVRPASNASDSQSQRSIPVQTPHPVMAPPLSLARPMSGSPHPNGQQTPLASQYHAPPNYYVAPVTPHFENFRKVPLKSVDEALIPKITFNTHYALNLPKQWTTSVPASKTKTSHSVTMVLPQHYSYLQVTPHIPVALTNRAYRVFVSVNGHKTFEVNRTQVTAGINGNGNPGDGGRKKGEPVFEAKLSAGINRVEVEIVAEKDRKGKPESKDPKEQIEVEKCTVFLNLARI
ncbi:Bromodomain-containing protein [Massarina eburnea CBS 473.64]|uniref:Bromodomain-containing protein n=1 Tax=Massarina eburnea CBS 473.64 TaxID=1395130 RepID=A0A6A6RJ34_9PLEO|nr:Bromodomain-containing protein [Massarina eburnea CBS 473.64]